MNISSLKCFWNVRARFQNKKISIIQSRIRQALGPFIHIQGGKTSQLYFKSKTKYRKNFINYFYILLV
ncbi:hypothetical protein ShirakiTB12_52530 [Priestia megaterium]|uniref:Uncharacterized protein n=1 Tax=Priestia megaterium TaxID=1404 RepID=A0AAX6BSU7_PRIMG|nr:hypothetical protein ShirakiTB12_52530 [Priestia megaterium]